MIGCVICNGEIDDYTHARRHISECSLVIAVNRECKHLAEMELFPDIVIEDLDFSETHVRQQERTLEPLSHPNSNEKSDIEYAVELAFTRGCRSVYLIGATGDRLDITMGNLLLLLRYPGRVALLDGIATLVAVDRSERCRIVSEVGSIVSLVPVPTAEGVTTTGLKHVMTKEKLFFETRGIGNVLNEKEGCVCISNGLLLVYVQNERPD